MTIHYAYFCICGHGHKQPTDECVKCGSADIERAPCFASVEINDAHDDARMEEIRANWDQSMERGKKLLAEINMASALDQLVELGSYELPPVESGWLRKRQA